MNKLVEKLKSQKARLPQEDHSIIDWAVSAIRVRMQQREELMDEISENITNIVSEFTRKLGKDSNPKTAYESLTSTLPDLIGKGSVLNYDEVTGKEVRKLKSHLIERFKDDKDSVNKIFELSSKFCDDKAKEIENKLKLESMNQSGQTHLNSHNIGKISFSNEKN